MQQRNYTQNQFKQIEIFFERKYIAADMQQWND